MTEGDMAEDTIRGKRVAKRPRVLPSLLKPLLLLVVATCLTGEVSANWPPCKSQCDSNFTEDDMLEHPGIKSVCHRGCELFTVALISTPRGGVPLVGETAFGQNGNFDITPEVANLMGVSEDLLKRIDNKKLFGKKTTVKATISNFEKAKKQKQELEQKIVHQMDSIGKTAHPHSSSSQKQDAMERMEQETHNIMHRLAIINAEKNKKVKLLSQKENVNKKTDSAVQPSKKEETIEENKKTLGHDHNEKKPHEIKIETINGHEVITFNEDIDCEEFDELERMLIDRKGLGIKDIINSKNIFQQVVYSKISDEKPSGSFVVSKRPQVTYSTVTGEAARNILDEVRRTNKSPIDHGHTLVEVQRISSEQPGNENTNGKVDLGKSAGFNNRESKLKGHGPVPLASLAKRPTARQTQLKSTLSNDPLSKTTVQPLSHPVQDHPVHANRQITTDSSGADERKTTTPKSSNPVAPVSQRIQEFGALSLLANKLGLADKTRVHPFLHLTFLPPKPMFAFEMPQQISIIEIVKKKNDIDFEKLHQEHLKEAAQCPMIHERFEQAKHSCRHACATAFNEAQEQDACVVGCQIQETSSTKQVKAMTPPTKIQSPLQRTTTTAQVKPEDGIVRPGGLFSTFSMMFSNLAGKIGQSMHKMWSYMTNRKSGWSQEGPGFPGSPSTKPDLPGAPAPKDSKMLGLPSAPHLGVQIFFKNIETGPNNVNIQSNGRPHETFINTETIFQYVDNRPPKSEAEVLNEQLEHREKLIQREMEREGNLLAQTIEMGQGGLKTSENELNHQIEILGKHLNEEPRKYDHGIPIIPKFIADFLFPKSRNFEFTPLKDHAPPAEDVFEKNEMKIFEQLFRSKSTLDDILKSQDVVKKSHSRSQSDDENSQKHDGSLKHDVEEKAPVKSTNSDCQTTSPDNVQIQQLDLLDCISRKSGLPRWLIGITVFASALVVFYLCFSLSTPVDESKLGKPKATTVVMCDALEDPCYDDDYCEKKKLLPEVDVLQIRLEAV